MITRTRMLQTDIRMITHTGGMGGTYEFVHAPRALGRMVASTVGYRSGGTTTRLHRGLPSPFLTLVFSLDEPIIAGESPRQALGREAYRAHIVVGGLHQRPAYIVQSPREAGVQLAVHPLAARALLGMPASELSLLIGDGRDVLGARAAELRERIAAAPDWETRFGILAGYLRRCSSGRGRRAEVRGELLEAWRWLERRGGTGAIDDLARHVALSPRQLTTLFRREVGIGPKQAGRLMRFQRARQAVAAAIAADRRPDLADVAAHCGFYDHSHLVRDFRQYTGTSPTGWMCEERRNIQDGGHRIGEEWDP